MHHRVNLTKNSRINDEGIPDTPTLPHRNAKKSQNGSRKFENNTSTTEK
jgi:hypothetical protein